MSVCVPLSPKEEFGSASCLLAGWLLCVGSVLGRQHSPDECQDHFLCWLLDGVCLICSEHVCNQWLQPRWMAFGGTKQTCSVGHALMSAEDALSLGRSRAIRVGRTLATVSLSLSVTRRPSTETASSQSGRCCSVPLGPSSRSSPSSRKEFGPRRRSNAMRHLPIELEACLLGRPLALRTRSLSV